MTQEGNWKTITSETVYQNNWIAVDHRDVITPSGGEGIYGLVRFKNKAIGIVALDDENYIYLVGQYRYPLSAYSWEIPEGGGPIDESPLEAAQRELKEETGLVASHWEKIGRVHTSNSATDEEGFIFLAQGLQQFEQETEETEEIEVRKVALQEAVAMVMRSEITDSISICAILMVARLKGI